MGKFKSNSDRLLNSSAAKAAKYRKALVKIRVALGLGSNARVEDVIAAVEDLVDRRSKERES